MKLLIVDDSAMIRRAINTAYQGSVFTDIQTAADGLLALTVFKRQMPDVVTLDITMPHMDGLAAMSQMLDIKPNTVILVISALADHHTAIESLMRGAHQFICKPFTADELKEALDNLLNENQDKMDKGRKGPVMESDKEIEETIAHITRKSTAVQIKAHPNPDEYPSGYVKPPEVEGGQDRSLLGQKAPEKKTSAVTRQIAISEIRHQLERERGA